MGREITPDASAARSRPPAGAPGGRRSVPEYGLGVLISGLVLAYGISLVVVERPVSGYNSLWDGWVLNLALALPLIPVIIGAVRQPERRLAWVMIGLGILLNSVADLVYLLHDQNLSPTPFPAASDVPYLLSYVGFIAGVALLARSPGRDARTGSSLDGFIAGLALATLVALLWFGPVLDVRGSLLEVLVGLAYPVFDLVLITVLVTNLILNRRTLDWALMTLMVGVMFFVIGDSIYLEQVAQDAYVPGTLLDLTWLLGIFFIGAAAAVPVPVERRRRSRDGLGAHSTATPLVFGLASMAVVAVALVTDPGPVQAVMVLAVFVAVVVRMWITVGALHEAEAASSRDANTDFLTGLSNRRDLLSRLEAMQAHPAALDGGVGMLLIDLDGFKEVNDSLGHLAGDELLRIVAARCERVVGPDAVLARLGGDEYACALPIAGPEELVAVAERLQAVVFEPISLDGMTLRVDASIGLATSTDEALDVVELLRRADVAMYEAKHARLGIATYRPDRDPNSRERLQLVEELREAIERRELVLHYQPAVDLRTGRTRGVEALVRWERPGHGMVMPDDFVPLAERFGLIPKLTRAVIEQAVAEVASLRARGHELGMSVNISGSDLVDEQLPTYVVDTLELHRVPPQLLTLEITESVLASDIDRAQRSIDRLRSDGIQISIDDYGVGYSSMSQLLSLHVDELKIDKSFVLALDSDDRASAIVRSAVEFARALGLTVVAEGIESAGVLERLHGLDVDIAQGFYVARPLTSAHLADFLATEADAPAEASPVTQPWP
jgi:diguanylate cyclase (GGDEF)-like protein